MAQTPRQFFEDAASYTGDKCLLWPFATQGHGYPKLNLDGKVQNGHRAMCKRVHGDPLPGQEAAHSCPNRSCITPKHLRWATPLENAADKGRHGTETKGEKNSQSKLTWIVVREIRTLRGVETQASLAVRFGVTQALISLVQANKIWQE